jgi:hypothetical protein
MSLTLKPLENFMKSVVLLEMKTELKSLAAQIRESRPLYRQAQSNESRKLPFTYPLLDPQGLGAKFRYLHIVRCLLRGRTMEQIEPSRRYTPYRFQEQIDELLAVYRPRLEAERAADVLEVPRAVG